jgi:hypothetical protein
MQTDKNAKALRTANFAVRIAGASMRISPCEDGRDGGNAEANSYQGSGTKLLKMGCLLQVGRYLVGWLVALPCRTVRNIWRVVLADELEGWSGTWSRNQPEFI